MSKRRRRVYLTLIAVGLAAVAGDRLWLADDGQGLAPRSAAGAQRAVPAAMLPDPSAEAKPGDGNDRPPWFPPAASHLPDSWSTLPLTADAAVREPFLPAPGFREAKRRDDGQPSGEDGAESRVVAFEDLHRLEAIVVSRTSRRAVIDDRILSLHDVLDGHILVEVGTSHVVFEGPQGRVTLELPRDEIGSDH